MLKKASLTTAGIALVGALLFITPAIVLWAVNTLLEAGGVAVHIPHGFSTYFATLVLIFIFRGNNG